MKMLEEAVAFHLSPYSTSSYRLWFGDQQIDADVSYIHPKQTVPAPLCGLSMADLLNGLAH